MGVLTTISDAKTRDRERVSLYLPKGIRKEVGVIARESGNNLSQLVSCLLQEYLSRVKADRLKRELAEECDRFFATDKKLADEWLPTEPET
jgi:hypothetical protein